VSAQIEVDRQIALARLEEASRLNIERNTLTVQTDGTTYKLSQLLAEIYNGEYCEAILGISFWEWVESKFRDDRGQPRKADWARGLVHQYGVVSEHPVLVDRLITPPRPGQPTVSFNSAYYTSKLCEAAGWHRKARKQAAEEVPGDQPEDLLKRNERAHDILDEWLVESALRKTREIREDIKWAKGEGDQRDPTHGWPFVGGKLDPAVKAHGDEVIATICLMADDGPSPDDLTFVQAYERLVGYADDCITAFRSVASTGNTSPLASLIESFKNLEAPEPEPPEAA
jgi:hypothetical protein